MRNALLGAILLAAAAYAIEGVGGWTSSELFTSPDVAQNITYPTGFGGVPWDQMTTFYFGSSKVPERADIRADAAGTIFLRVSGEIGTIQYSGLVRCDGAGFTHLVQDSYDGAANPITGSEISAVGVSPVTAGWLKAGQPVIVRGTGPDNGDYYWELSAVDATVSPATETLLDRWVVGDHGVDSVVVDADGALYVLVDDTIRKVAWNGSGYGASTLATDVHDGLSIDANGNLYTFGPGYPWGAIVPRVDKDILRVDRTTGAKSVFASFDLAGAFFRGWAWDSDGRLWIGLRDSKQSYSYIVEVTQGMTINGRTYRSRISESPLNAIRCFTAGPEGELIVLEWPGLAADPNTVSTLTPGSGGGGGHGGGGGKGKNK